MRVGSVQMAHSLRACTRLDSGLSTMEMRWKSKPALHPTVSPSLHSDSVEYVRHGAC